MGELTAAIAQVGKGITRAKPLTAEAAAQAMETILSGRADPFELGAFLVAMRIKEETAEELCAFVRVADAHIRQVPGVPPDLVIPSYAGKRQTFPVVLASAVVMAAAGVTVGLHGHGTPPERMALADAVRALGGNPDATPEDAARQLARAGLAYVGIEMLSPVMTQMLALRAQMGLRSCFHTMARIINPYRAPHLMVGISHDGTFEKLLAAAHALGFAGAAAFRGLEGEAEVNPFTESSGMMLGPDGRITPFPIDPQTLGIAPGRRADITVPDASAGAALVREVLAGRGPTVARDAVVLSAAAGLMTTGRAADLATGLAIARNVMESGEGERRLARWTGI